MMLTKLIDLFRKRTAQPSAYRATCATCAQFRRSIYAADRNGFALLASLERIKFIQHVQDAHPRNVVK
jgi:hypothetical protein